MKARIIVKRFLVLCLFFLAASAGADPLWNNAIDIYESYNVNKPTPKKSYRLMETGVPGGKMSSNEIWEEYKTEGEQVFRKVIKIAKNGVETPLPEKAGEKWFPIDKSKPDPNKDYKGLDQIFMRDQQKNVKFKKTGQTKTLDDKVCDEYSFEIKATRKSGKEELVIGKTYLEQKTGAPLEIRRENTSILLKGSPDSFIRFAYDGKNLSAIHFLLAIQMNFFGKQSIMKSEAKLEY